MSPNPITTPKGGAIQLTPDDLALLDQIHLTGGDGDINDYIMHRMCVMQLCMLLTFPPEIRESILTGGEIPSLYRQDTETLDYYPICVSLQITQYMVDANDQLPEGEREQLKSVIPDIMNTCPVVRRTKGGVVEERRSRSQQYKRAELVREEILTRDVTSIEERLALIREAANVLRTAPALPQGGNNEDNISGDPQPPSGDSGPSQEQA